MSGRKNIQTNYTKISKKQYLCVVNNKFTPPKFVKYYKLSREMQKTVV
jgi:hypothetical protein